jgi:hypothetical protein
MQNQSGQSLFALEYFTMINCKSSFFLMLKGALVLGVFCVFLPLIPAMPSQAELDPSWVIGINQAVSQHMRFGKELIFTFSPYASIYTKGYHPATEHLELIGSLYLAFLYSLALLGLLRHANAPVIAGMLLLLAGFTTSYDSLFFSYGLLTSIYALQIISEEKTGYQNNHFKNVVSITLLFSGFGLYPLIKGTLFAFYLAIALVTVAYCLWRKQWLYAILVPSSAALCMMMFWSFSGQQLGDLASYYNSISSIIAGYSDAMSSKGNGWEIVTYILASTSLCLYLLLKGGISVKNIYLFLIFSLFLFINFKAGFVRHDQHSLMCGIAVFFSALLIFNLFPSKLAIALTLLSGIVLLQTESSHKQAPFNSAYEQFKSTYVRTWTGAQLRILHHDQIEDQFKESLESLAKIRPLPTLPGKSDIYPFDQAYLMASNNRWVTRPIFQSYSVYNPKLSSLNEEFLKSPRAPDNIFFRMATIDGRLPSGDDGNSWPALLNQYQLKDTQGNYLILQIREAPRPEKIATINTGIHPVNTWIELPINNGNVFANVDIKPTLLGRFKTLFFKSSELGIALRLEDGTIKQYRLIPGIAISNFLLSPLIEETVEFGLLYSDSKALAIKRVKAISIWAEGNPRDWQKSYELTLKTIN